jgi:uncharacterized protein (DUF2164 family)
MSTREQPPGLLKTLGAIDYNKCFRHRAAKINKKIAKFFYHNALPFNLVESDEFADFVKKLSPAYYQQGIPRRFWMETTSDDLVYKNIHEEAKKHLQNWDSVMANMDGW